MNTSNPSHPEHYLQIAAKMVYGFFTDSTGSIESLSFPSFKTERTEGVG